MIRPIKDSMGALEGALESLLISYQYEASKKTLVIVLDYPDKAAGADRAFLRLRFMSVSDFHRVPGTFADLQRFKESYSTRETPATTVVQRVDIEKKEDSLRITLSFGSFGDLAFVFRSLWAESRSARATKTSKNTWTYHDVDDGKPVDFYDPFA
ncbi:hypothetical protein Q664_05170 [Archangium violaceum Cb vi76]|uniref:Uncharacterized protein n=2 Tax=Archangium violaceum TaxID=83451 RepID=A0A084T001_9BACT|nr:hypothetical protein Q664_05170 [Archangium violaceum Cb vi76]